MNKTGKLLLFGIVAFLAGSWVMLSGQPYFDAFTSKEEEYRREMWMQGKEILSEVSILAGFTCSVMGSILWIVSRLRETPSEQGSRK